MEIFGTQIEFEITRSRLKKENNRNYASSETARKKSILNVQATVETRSVTKRAAEILTDRHGVHVSEASIYRISGEEAAKQIIQDYENLNK